MHKEDIEYIDYSTGKPIKKLVKDVPTFDTVVHVNKGKKHALKDIERLLKEEKENG